MEEFRAESSAEEERDECPPERTWKIFLSTC